MRYRVVAWLTMAAAMAYLCRNGVGVIESTVRAELGLTTKQSGWFIGAFFWSYAIMQVPSGRLGQVWGSRVTFTVMALTWSLAAAGLAMAQSLGVLIAAYLLMGAAQACLMPCAATTISHWIPLRSRSGSCGSVGMGLQIGAIAAAFGTAALMASGVSWRTIYLLYAVPGVVWAVWFFIRFRDDPAKDTAVNAAELALIRSDAEPAQARAERSRIPWAALARSPTMGWLCGQQICRSAGYGFFAGWFPSFLQTARGVSKENSGYIQAVVLAGALCGCLLGGVFSDWVLRRTGSLHWARRGVGSVSQLICALLVLSAFFVQDVALTAALLSLGAFCTFGGGTGALAVSIDVGGRHAPHVYAIQNMMGCFAGGYMPVLVGAFFQNNDDWNGVLLMFAGIYLVAAVCWALVDPTAKIERESIPA